MKINLGLSFLLLILVKASAMRLDHTPEIIEQVTSLKAAPLPPYVDPLPQPAQIDVALQPYLTIGMYMTKQKFHQNLSETTVFAYGTSATTATFPGPTIVATRFVPTYVTWENHLPPTHILPWDTTIAAALPINGGVPTVVHLHAGAIAPEDDGHAFAWYTANYSEVGSTFTKKTYTYPNVQHAGNLMYHDHAVGLTRINLLAGLLGAYVIREPALELLYNLPSGPEFDLLLVIADRSFNADGSINMNPVGVIPNLHPSWIPEYYGDAITVNGKIWPYLNVQRRKYRFRIINASNARYYNIAFNATTSSITTTTYPFTVIGSDSSYLNTPITVTSALFSVAETFDIVFDFSTVTEAEIELTNNANYPYPNGQVPVDGLAKIMKFIISPAAVVDPSVVPATLANHPPALANQTRVTRYLALYEYLDAAGNTMHLLINGKRFSEPATEIVQSGSTELWNVINLTVDDHPLHIHLAHFQSIGSSPLLNSASFKACMQIIYDPVLCNLQVGPATPVPLHEQTWKNVVKLPPGQMTSVVVKFNMVDTGAPYPFDATAAPGYVYHCHILDHEDNEMIRPLLLIR